MKKNNKLHIKFHNPNSRTETEKYLIKLMATIAVEKYLCITDPKLYHSTKCDNNI